MTEKLESLTITNLAAWLPRNDLRQSAAGSITSCRDVNNQAVFVLKGKPLNVWDLNKKLTGKYSNHAIGKMGFRVFGVFRGCNLIFRKFATGATPVLRLDKISPKEFAQFIGKEMVLAHGHRVEYAPRAESGPLFMKLRCRLARRR